MARLNVFLLALMLCAGASAATSATLTLAWDANSEEDLLGYRVYWGIASGKYLWSADVGRHTQYRIENLQEGVNYYIAVTALDYWGNESPFSREIRTVSGESLPLPKELELQLNYPNPFNSGTLIEYALPENAEIELSVFNSLGQQIRLLYSGPLAAGFYQTYWDGLDEQGTKVAAGTYFCVLKSGQTVLKRAMSLMR